MAAVLPHTRPAVHDAAFERLYRRYVKDVYRYSLALLHNPADAEDVTQTTFLNAWRAWCRGVDPQRPHNWLIKIAHNAARTRYAAQARRPSEVPFDDRLDELAMPPDERPQVAGILHALGRLPFNQRSALVMRELEGRSYSEIADTLDVSVAAVETLIFRARRTLRMHASKLRGLAVVQLPQSLASFFENGAISGGAVVGSGLVAKLALLLAAGAVAGGIGYKTVQATSANGRPPAADVPAAPGVFANEAAVAASPARRAGSAGAAVTGRFDPAGHFTSRRQSASAHDTSGAPQPEPGSPGRAPAPTPGHEPTAAPSSGGGAKDPVSTASSLVPKLPDSPVALPPINPSVPTVSPPSVPAVNTPTLPAPPVKKLP